MINLLKTSTNSAVPTNNFNVRMAGNENYINFSDIACLRQIIEQDSALLMIDSKQQLGDNATSTSLSFEMRDLTFTGLKHNVDLS